MLFVQTSVSPARWLLCLLVATGFFILPAGAAPPESGTLRIDNPWPDAADQFGTSVALRGSLLAVGAPGEDDAGVDVGAVHLFVDGVFQDTLTPSDAPEGAGFGTALAISPTRLAVGAPGADGLGAVYVFRKRGGGGWDEEAKLQASAGQLDAFFGLSVDLQGSTVVAGAPFEDSSRAVAGAVYVFNGGAHGKWSETARLVPSGLPSGGIFGASVAIRGHRLVAGAPYLAVMFVPGQAHLYEKAGGEWVHAQRLSSTASGGRDRFGASVGLTPNSVLVGAPRDAPPPFGFVNEFRSGRDVTTGERIWLAEQTLSSPNAVAFDRFGARLAVDGRSLVVGATTAGTTGDAVLFSYGRKGWEPAMGLDPGDLSDGDQFGAAVALDGARIAVGAPGTDGAGDDEGAVYLYGRLP